MARKASSKHPELLLAAIGSELTEPLYHYTPQTGLLGIIDSKSLWASNILYMNDATEAKLAHDLINEAIGRRLDIINAETLGYDRASEIWNLLMSAMKELGHIVDLEVYACCFSSSRDKLSQWRGYAGEGGFALAFKPGAISTIAQSNNMRLVKCIYDRDQNAAIADAIVESAIENFDHLKKSTDHGSAEQEAVHLLKESFLIWVPMCKHEGFEEEGEWRLVKRSDISNQDDRLYHRASKYCVIGYKHVKLGLDYNRPTDGRLDLGFHDLLVGPTPVGEVAGSSAWNMITRAGIYINQVTPSGVPFRPV